MNLAFCICWIDSYSSSLHLLLTCASSLLTFSISVTLCGLLGTLDNLELRKKKGVSRLAFNDVGLAGLVGDVDATLHVMRPAMTLFAQAMFGEVFEDTWKRISEKTLRYYHALGLLELEDRNSSYFAWSNSMISDSTIFPMKVTSPCVTTCSSLEKVVPSGVAISCLLGKNLENVNRKIFLNQWKITTILNIPITRERRYSNSNLLFI